jgi:LruC domain-containing protein
MNKKILSFLIGLAVIGSSCKKDGIATDVENATSDLVVPKSFAWQTVKDVNLSVGITDSRFGNKIHVISVYLADPATGVEPISKGAATLVRPFNIPVSIPSTVREVYIVKTAPDGSSTTEKMAVNGTSMSFALSSVSMSAKISSTSGDATAVTEPSCGTSTTDANININSSSDIICFNATNDVTINVNANNGGTLKLNAPGKTITLGNFNHTNLKLFIAAGTTVAWNNDLNISSGESFVNNGTLKGNKINLEGVLINNKELSANNLTVNANGELNNYCNLSVSGEFINNKLVNNYKLMVVGSTRINATGILNLHNAAMFQTTDFLVLDGTVYGVGSTSLFKTTGATASPVYDNDGRFSGSVQYCGDKQLNVNQNNKVHFYNGAVQSCEVFIAKDDCNGIGNGTASQPDRDNDGVIDSQDDFPDDPTKAFRQKSPNYDGGGSTLAFEDSWPSAGDYDLNDVVLRYKIEAITNAKNVVVQINGSYDLIASGGDFHNGVGVQFNIPAKNIKTGGLSAIRPEGGQDSLIVILFKDTRAAQKNWNTIKGEATSAPVNAKFSFDVTNGPEIKEIGIGKFNPFIWNGSSKAGRGHETHLRGKPATKLADQSLFNTGDDASSLGVTYSTADNLPWAIEIPVADFRYPVEKANIREAYLKFTGWASSGGNSNVDWYSSTEAGFRDNSKIY